jgi:hypothetical protein
MKNRRDTKKAPILRSHGVCDSWKFLHAPLVTCLRHTQNHRTFIIQKSGAANTHTMVAGNLISSQHPNKAHQPTQNTLKNHPAILDLDLCRPNFNHRLKTHRLLLTLWLRARSTTYILANGSINTLSPQTKPPSDGTQQLKITVSRVLIGFDGKSIDQQNLGLILSAPCRSFYPITHNPRQTVHAGLFTDFTPTIHSNSIQVKWKRWGGLAHCSFSEIGLPWGWLHLFWERNIYNSIGSGGWTLVISLQRHSNIAKSGVFKKHVAFGDVLDNSLLRWRALLERTSVPEGARDMQEQQSATINLPATIPVKMTVNEWANV